MDTKVIYKLSYFLALFFAQSSFSQISTIFSPSLKSTVTFIPREFGNAPPEKHFLHYEGHIQVSPPKGTCVIIRGRKDRDDFRTCKDAILTFSVLDLDKNGDLYFDYYENNSSFSESLTWKTPYLVGKAIKEGNTLGSGSFPIGLKDCKAEVNPISGRQITLVLFNDDNWVVTFPTQDHLAPQPTKKLPNLYVQENELSSGFIKVESAQQKSDRRIERARSEQLGPNGEAITDVLDEEAEADPNFIRSEWQMHPRGAYIMDGSHFKMGSSPPPNMRSQCRYKYQEDSSAYGFLECKNVVGFAWLYLPLKCISDLRPKR